MLIFSKKKCFFAVSSSGKERTRVGMRGGGEDLIGGALFDDFAAVHDENAVAEVADDGEVVADEEHGEGVISADALQQYEELGLD